MRDLFITAIRDCVYYAAQVQRGHGPATTFTFGPDGLHIGVVSVEGNVGANENVAWEILEGEQANAVIRGAMERLFKNVNPTAALPPGIETLNG